MERLLDSGEAFGPETLDPAVPLGPLLGIELRRLIRMGPSSGPGGRLDPAGLLLTAQEATVAGWLGIGRLVELRRLLTGLEASLRACEAWAPDEPLWWQPLPDDIAVESLWRRLEASEGSPHGSPEASPEAGWVALPGVLPRGLCASLYADLERSFAVGALDLDRGTVGASDETSEARSDEVRYLSGREPGMLEAAPRLAVTIQWCLASLAERAARIFPWIDAHPPARAMLARYPAPSGGFSPHLDNPGGEQDNGRLLSLVLYLNPPEAPCRGGELALWSPGVGPASEPAAVLPAAGGSAVLFDSRTVGHEVRALESGPARWSLAVWLNAEPQEEILDLPLPSLDATDVLLPIAAPPLPPDTLLFHELGEPDSKSRITVHRRGPGEPRVGVVCTAYRAGEELPSWCRYHFEIGFEHLVLVFDGLEEPSEAALAERLRETWTPDKLTLWNGRAILGRAASGALPEADRELLACARGGRGAQAVSARQTLNATAALRAAKTGELTGRGVDWLVHLDADERFHLEGPGRGGSTIGEHFGALDTAGILRVRYLNHELLQPVPRGGEARFKLNPALAASRLGSRGWALLTEELAMGPENPRPYFHGYVNGKSAVAVRVGVAAGGVHGWLVDDIAPESSLTLAGPSVLHFHYASAEAFGRRYLALAMTEDPPPAVLFDPYGADARAFELARSLHVAGESEKTIGARLGELHRTLTGFTGEEVEILVAAGLLVTPGCYSGTSNEMSG